MIKFPVERYGETSDSDVSDQDGHICTAESREYADEIVRILNIHADLVAALEAAKNFIWCNCTSSTSQLRAIDNKLHDAIDRAKGATR